MTLLSITNTRGVLSSLSQKSMKPSLAYKIVKFFNKTEEEEKFFIEKVNEIAEKYNATRNDDGNLTISKDFVDDFKKEMEEVQNTEAEDPNIRFSLSDFDGDITLTPAQMTSICEFIEE